VVTINGKDHYLGKWNTRASRNQYDRLIAEWLAGGRNLTGRGSDVTVAEVAVRYWRFAKAYYVKDGCPTHTVGNVKQALRPLRRMYGNTLAQDFGPLALKAVRQTMLESGLLNRTTINDRIGIVKRLFKWAVAEELIPPAVYQGLQAVSGLRMGRTEARESSHVPPVADEVVDATLPYLPPVAVDMVRLQRLTGCRPGEVCCIRPCDVDRSHEVWQYRPVRHKTQHRGRERIVYIGPQAQNVLRPYLLRSAESYCFSPEESEGARKAEMRARRKTPVQPSQINRRKRRPLRKPSDHYDNNVYARAIRRAVELANRKRKAEAEKAGLTEWESLPYWAPNQLRHTRATDVRRQFGLEAAQVVLGHTRADVTQVYAERDTTLAVEIMRKIG
jgi:integrase